MKTIIYSRRIPTRNEPEAERLRAVVENRSDTVIATFHDDPTILSKGKYAGWRALVASLDQADQVVVGSAVDLPGRRVQDLLKILGVLNEHGVGLCLHREGINTNDGAAAILTLIAFYKKAKLSEAIKVGQAKSGKRIGRPRVPEQVRRGIRIALRNDAEIRATARKYNVSPASVINIKRMMDAEDDRLAA